MCCVVIQTNMCNKINSKTKKVSWILISIFEVYDAFYFENYHYM